LLLDESLELTAKDHRCELKHYVVEMVVVICVKHPHAEGGYKRKQSQELGNFGKKQPKNEQGREDLLFMDLEAEKEETCRGAEEGV
jgi:hypothetical protein